MPDRDEAERRRRIMDAALELATTGGLDALQIREVVARTGVSSATVYRYFSSKEQLLLAALLDQRNPFAPLAPIPAFRGRTPTDRVIEVITPTTRALTRSPAFAHAMLRALLAGDPELSSLQRRQRTLVADVIARAIRDGEPSPAELDVASTIQRVWFAEIFGWAAGIVPAEGITESVRLACNQLLGAEVDDGAASPNR